MMTLATPTMLAMQGLPCEPGRMVPVPYLTVSSMTIRIAAALGGRGYRLDLYNCTCADYFWI